MPDHGSPHPNPGHEPKWCATIPTPEASSGAHGTRPRCRAATKVVPVPMFRSIFLVTEPVEGQYSLALTLTGIGVAGDLTGVEPVPHTFEVP